MRPIRRAVIRITPEDLATALRLDGDVASVRFDHQREVVEILVCADTLDPVELMAEPPIVDRASLTRPDRYRLAWFSARRRAARLASILDDGPPLDLVLDEQRETVRWDHPDANPLTDLMAATDPHNVDLLLGRTVHPQRVVAACRRYPDAEFVHSAGPCTDPLEADPDDNPAGHPRHTNDLREPSVLVGHDAGGRPLFNDSRPWWLCHTTGLVHTEGPCILRTDPLDLRAGQGPIVLTEDVRATLFGAQARTR